MMIGIHISTPQESEGNIKHSPRNISCSDNSYYWGDTLALHMIWGDHFYLNHSFVNTQILVPSWSITGTTVVNQ